MSADPTSTPTSNPDPVDPCGAAGDSLSDPPAKPPRRILSTAEALLGGLRKQGFRLRLEGDRLYVEPRAKLTPVQDEAIKAAKAELLSLLGWEDKPGPADPSIFPIWFMEVEKPPKRRRDL